MALVPSRGGSALSAGPDGRVWVAGAEGHIWAVNRQGDVELDPLPAVRAERLALDAAGRVFFVPIAAGSVSVWARGEITPLPTGPGPVVDVIAACDGEAFVVFPDRVERVASASTDGPSGAKVLARAHSGALRGGSFFSCDAALVFDDTTLYVADRVGMHVLARATPPIRAAAWSRGALVAHGDGALSFAGPDGVSALPVRAPGVVDLEPGRPRPFLPGEVLLLRADGLDYARVDVGLGMPGGAAGAHSLAPSIRPARTAR